MKKAGVESKILHLPEEAYNKKGYYDSDGEVNENWQDDTLDAQLEDSFEYFDDEDETTGNKEISQENLEKIRAFKEKIGKSAIRAVGLLDKLAA